MSECHVDTSRSAQVAPVRIQQAIHDAFAVGRSEWPNVALITLESFRRHIEGLRTADADLKRHGADLYLAFACGCGDRQALRQFESKFVPELHAQLLREGFDRATGDDVIQQLMLHLCAGSSPRILTYAGRAALASWLRVATIRFAINLQQRKDERHRTDSDLAIACLFSDGQDPELKMTIEVARPLFQDALTLAMKELGERDLTLLRLYFLDGASVDAIGKLYAVHRATAARWIVEIRERILATIRHHLTLKCGVSPSDFDSLAHLVRSQLAFSLRRVLGAA